MNGLTSTNRRIPVRRFPVRIPVPALLCAALMALPVCAVADGLGTQAAGGPERDAGGGGRDRATSAKGGEGAPVISAPSAPGRAAPPTDLSSSAEGLAGFNSFAATDMPPPALDGLGLSAMPVVVELFTSQGCSSCPPADAMMSMLAGQRGVLPLSFHVDYWDYLGWADSFARPEFSARQEAYARVAGERSVYTPQLIVAGTDTAVAPGPAQIKGLIETHQMAPALLNVQRSKKADADLIELMPLSDLGGEVEVSLIRFLPERSVEVRGGENDGRSITYTNVVLAMERLAKWDGAAPLRLNVRAGEVSDDRFPDDTRHVILVQQDQPGGDLPGSILAAIVLD